MYQEDNDVKLQDVKVDFKWSTDSVTASSHLKSSFNTCLPLTVYIIIVIKNGDNLKTCYLIWVMQHNH